MLSWYRISSFQEEMLLWETVISILSSQITGRNEPNFNVNMYCILDEKKRCKSCNTNSSPCAPCIHTCVPTCYTWTVPTLDDSHLVREISDWCNDGPWSFGARGFNATQIYFSLTLFYTTCVKLLSRRFVVQVLAREADCDDEEDLLSPSVSGSRSTFFPCHATHKRAIWCAGYERMQLEIKQRTNERLSRWWMRSSVKREESEKGKHSGCARIK